MITGLIRTFVPYLVVWLLSLPFAPALLSALGLSSAQAKEQLTGLLVLVAGSVYYAAARWLEERFRPEFGWLLGIARRPLYEATAAGGHSAEKIAANLAGVQLVGGDVHSAP